MRHLMFSVFLLSACASEEAETSPASSAENEPAETSNAVGNPYEAISPAPPDVLAAVAQSYVFVGMLGKLMEGYQPVLPEVEDPDLLRCMTEEAFTYDGELKKLDQSLEKQVRDAEAAREATKKEFYLRVYPPQFRIDHNWASRPGIVGQPVYGCWDMDDRYWEDDVYSRSDCGYSWQRWRQRYVKWVETDEVNLYSREATPKRPELMIRMEKEGLKERERLHCAVGEVVHPQDAKYACNYGGNDWEFSETRSECRSYGGRWRAYQSKPGPHAFISCLGPINGDGLVEWMDDADLLDPTPNDSADNALFSKDNATSAVNTLSGERSPSFSNFKGAFSLKINTEIATGVLIGDVISVPLANMSGLEDGVVFADFGPYHGRAPNLDRWTIHANSLKVEANGVCPSDEDVAAALCQNFTKRTDKERALAACTTGKQPEKLSGLIAEWERMRFDDKPTFMRKAYAALTSDLSSTDPDHFLQLAAWNLEGEILESRKKDARGALVSALRLLEKQPASGDSKATKSALARAAKIAADAGFDDLVERAQPTTE